MFSMKLKKKRVFAMIAVCLFAMVNISTVFGAWWDPGYTVKADGRWYQWFGFTATKSEKVSSGYNGYSSVLKLYTSRDAAVEVTSIANKAYPVSFTVYTYGACAIPDSVTATFGSTGAQALPYYSGVLANYKCIGYVISSRASVTNPIKGVWSPDSYQ